jgi:hypothetical protein
VVAAQDRWVGNTKNTASNPNLYKDSKQTLAAAVAATAGKEQRL